MFRRELLVTFLRPMRQSSQKFQRKSLVEILYLCTATSVWLDIHP
jgi:hypothetical protein